MALVYAADLRFIEAADRSRDADPHAIIPTIAEWAHVVDPLAEGERPGRRGGTATIDLVGGAELEGWRLTVAHDDWDDPSVTWTVTTTLTTTDGTHLAVRVDRSRSGALRPVTSTPKPPRYLRDLLGDTRFVATDATRDLRIEHVQVTAADAEDFAEFLRSPRRRLPVIGYTPRDDEVLDAEAFVKRNAGTAHVALVHAGASWQLSDLLPEGHSVYGGAVRIWWPGIDERSVKWNHPLWTAERPAEEIYREVAETIRRVAISTSPRDPRFAAIEGRERAREIQSLRDGIRDYEAILTEATEPDATIETMRRTTAALEDLEIAQMVIADAEERAREAEERYRLAELERDRYEHELRELRRVVSAHDECDLFRRELDRAVAEAGLAADARWYTIGPDFLPSLESLGTGYRAKTIKACRAIVGRDPSLLGKVRDHPLGDGRRSTGQARRSSCGRGEARRAAIENSAPSARRVHYWLLDDGSIELASVNVHDDLSIPEPADTRRTTTDS